MSSKKVKWSSQWQGFQDALSYMKGRMEGNIKSILTPWQSFNNATTNGIEFNSLTVIGARPGAGKTLIKDQIIRELHTLNPGQDFRVLEFSLEMVARNSALREFTSFTGMHYKKLCSADGSKIDTNVLRSCADYAAQRLKYPIDVIEEAPTAIEFGEIIEEYMEHHAVIVNMNVKQQDGSVKTQNVKVYKKTIVTLDHSILIKTSPFEKNKNDMLFNLGAIITVLKKKYPIAFIVLSQLNRNIDAPERNEDGKYGNYVLESDIFGADAMLQYADTLIGVNKPSKQKIKRYGPEMFLVEDDHVVMHYLKCRNSDVGIGFYKAKFDIMKLLESDPPPQASKRMSTVS